MEGDSTVAIAALGVLATTVGLMAWVVKKVLGDVAPALAKHADTADHLSKMVIGNTESTNKQILASDELLIFMRRLNGKLENAVIQKVAEQTVEHQTVNISDHQKTRDL